MYKKQRRAGLANLSSVFVQTKEECKTQGWSRYDSLDSGHDEEKPRFGTPFNSVMRHKTFSRAPSFSGLTPRENNLFGIPSYGKH